MVENETTRQAKIIASAKLSQEQVQQALVEFVGKDDRLRDALTGQQAVAWLNWHVNKWDSPDSFCTVSFGVVGDEDSEASPIDTLSDR